VRTKKSKKLHRPRVSMVVPTRANERWSMDFVHDQLADGRRFRIFNVADDYSRECIGQVVDTSISGYRVSRLMLDLLKTRRKPKSLVCDKGTEFSSMSMFFCARDNHLKLSFIQPGKPTKNAFLESFYSKFRDSCLDHHQFRLLTQARDIIKTWRKDYNQIRPHIAF